MVNKILSRAKAITDFLCIIDSNTQALNTNGIIDRSIAMQTQNAQNFYNNTQNKAINSNSYSYAD